jgi:hypothetical protein
MIFGLHGFGPFFPSLFGISDFAFGEFASFAIIL